MTVPTLTHRRPARSVLRRLALPLTAATLFVLSLPAVPAAAASAPVWSLVPRVATSVPSGGFLVYKVELLDRLGSAEEEAGPPRFTVTLPAGLSLGSGAGEPLFEPFDNFGWECTGEAPGSQSLECVDPTDTLETRPPGTGTPTEIFTVRVAVAASLPDPTVLTARFALSGGGRGSAAAIAPTTITAAPPTFGIDAFDGGFRASGGADVSQAAGHPDTIDNAIVLQSSEQPGFFKGEGWPVEPVRDLIVELPPGLLANPSGEKCTITQLAQGNFSTKSECPIVSQVGTITLHVGGILHSTFGPLPLFRMVPAAGEPARFGFNAGGTVVFINARLRSSSDYGVNLESRQISEGLAITSTLTEFWNDPAAESHDPFRACPGTAAPFENSPTCAGVPAPPLLRLPTSCTGPLPFSLYADSWWSPGAVDSSGNPSTEDPAWRHQAFFTHKSPGFPANPNDPETPWGEAQGLTGCGRVPFTPGFSAQPTTNAADSPSGLAVDITIPQSCWGEEEDASICQSDLKEARVTLPQGMTLNPSAANGLGACTPEQVGLLTPSGSTPIHFNEEPVNCPNDSKIGSVDIETPLLEEPLKGAVYLAKQKDNPFNSLLAMYLVAEGSGVVVKQAGEIEVDPQTGRLVTSFDEVPQTPFSDLHVELFGGPNAPLRTPSTCGTFAATARLTPWSGNPAANLAGAFDIEKCPNTGFSPKLEAGTQNPLAGTTSSFSLRLSREDGTQELSGLTATLPPGLSGYLKGIAYCPDSTLGAISSEEGTGAAQEAHPSCPAASQVGAVTVGAGAGADPFYTQSGRAYLAGPYKGAPLSLAVVTPAVAGPFDLGTVVVRNALQVNPETAQITAVSDEIPHILHGIPLDLRDVRVNLNREHFTLNPTSCEPMSIGSTITSMQGASANPSARFQAAGCERLAFKPKLSLRLKGKTNRGAHPALTAVLTMPPANQANIARAQVTLPHAEFLDQGHIKNVCTRVQFAAGGCPASSILGYAKAFSPLLEQPLQGPVYLMSGFGHKLPDVAADLNGQIRVLLHGKVDTGPGGGIRNTFEVVPDAPVTKFTLSLKGGRRGLIVNSEGICSKPQHATALFDAQNGKVSDFDPALKADCATHRKHKRRS